MAGRTLACWRCSGGGGGGGRRPCRCLKEEIEGRPVLGAECGLQGAIKCAPGGSGRETATKPNQTRNSYSCTHICTHSHNTHQPAARRHACRGSGAGRPPPRPLGGAAEPGRRRRRCHWTQHRLKQRCCLRCRCRRQRAALRPRRRPMGRRRLLGSAAALDQAASPEPEGGSAGCTGSGGSGGGGTHSFRRPQAGRQQSHTKELGQCSAAKAPTSGGACPAPSTHPPEDQRAYAVKVAAERVGPSVQQHLHNAPRSPRAAVVKVACDCKRRPTLYFFLIKQGAQRAGGGGGAVCRGNSAI